MAAQKAAHMLKVKTVVAPPPPSLSLVAQNLDIPVFCQHLDDMQAGQSTGFFIPELARSFGASGSILNHSEHRLEYQTIRSLVQTLRKLDMVSVVCARTPDEAAELARLNPNFIAIEPPELIGSGKAVSKENPKVILDTVKLVSANSESTRVICGAGIVDKSDVRSAVDLGVIGILVASGIVKAKSWYEKILELGSGLSE
jgi:triosephosphate isomerase (TIM)